MHPFLLFSMFVQKVYQKIGMLFFLSACVFSAQVSAVDIVDFSKESPQLQVQRIRDQNAEQQLQIEALQQELLRLNGRLEQVMHRLDTVTNELEAEKNARIAAETASVTRTAAPAESTVIKTTATAAVNVGETVNKAGDLAVYQSAFDALKAKNYSSAKTKFTVYLDRFPKGEYAASAYYWLGEIYLLEDESVSAEQSFQKVINNFPSDSKAARARFKLAQILNRADEHEKAKVLLKYLMSAKNSDDKVRGLANSLWKENYTN